MEKSDILDLLKKVTEDVTNNGVDEDMLNALKTLSESFEKHQLIDKEMIKKLQDMFSDELVKKDALNMVRSVEEGSTIVYFKSAQLFKLYKKEELEMLLSGQLSTIYKHLNQSYEVVPNSSNQKIIIMGDVSLIDKIDHIKKHITQFMHTKGIKSFKSEDIVCFKSNILEIVINNYYVNNSEEREAIVKDLMKYILSQDKNESIVRQIQTLKISDIEGADMYPMPSEKQLLGNVYIDMVDRLVRNTTQCTNLNRSGNTYILNFGNITVTNIEKAENVTITSSDKVGDFVTYLKTNKPSWYKEGTFMNKSILYTKYIEQFGDITKFLFTSTFKDKIFAKETRTAYRKGDRRTVVVKVFKYNDMVNL